MSSAGTIESTQIWYALDATLEGAAREAVEYGLMEAGALGTEANERDQELVRVTAYFDAIPDRERVWAELMEALRIYALPSSLVRNLSIREVQNQDWLEQWKKNWQPVTVGERFIIAPPWSEIPDTHERILIRIEPGMAFGTGTHETTRLCLAAIEKYFAGGSFLDVGTGTGILAIAAAKLFPTARIEACDTDAGAIAIARENALLNAVSDNIVFRTGTIDEREASAELVCANLSADAIVELLPRLVATTCGRLILAGILDSQVEMVLLRLRERGDVQSGQLCKSCEVTTENEWAAIVV
jgi:ribosomal protein L11 methyltransferase